MVHFYLIQNSPGSVKCSQVKPHIPVSPLGSGVWEVLRASQMEGAVTGPLGLLILVAAQGWPCRSRTFLWPGALPAGKPGPRPGAGSSRTVSNL